MSDGRLVKPVSEVYLLILRARTGAKTAVNRRENASKVRMHRVGMLAAQ